MARINTTLKDNTAKVLSEIADRDGLTLASLCRTVLTKYAAEWILNNPPQKKQSTFLTKAPKGWKVNSKTK